MKRTYEEKSRQLITSVKPTTLNLQPRGFAPPQSESDEDVSSQTNKAYPENILKKLISTPTSESSAASIQRKPQNRLKAITSQQMEIQAKQNDESSAESNLASIHGKPQNRLKAIASQGRAIQAKLNIGGPNDKYEKEADDTASKVVQQINSPTQDKSVQKQELMEEEDELQMKPISTIQREASMEEEDELQMKSLVQKRENLGGGEASTDLESSIQSARGGGQSLDASLQTKMGEVMGADFSNVKVHTDSQSDQLNKSIQAKAFTTGQDVFFRQGAYEPSSQGGQELIAHELTHVVQQNANTVQTKHNKIARKLHSGGRQIIQRLKFEGTRWDTATNAGVSKGGGLGVVIEYEKEAKKPENRLKMIRTEKIAIQAKLNIGESSNKDEKQADENSTNDVPQNAGAVQRSIAINNSQDETTVNQLDANIEKVSSTGRETIQRLALQYGNSPPIPGDAKNLAAHQDGTRGKKIDVQKIAGDGGINISDQVYKDMANGEDIFLVAHGRPPLGDQPAMLESGDGSSLNGSNIAGIFNTIRSGLKSENKSLGEFKIEACMSSLKRKTKGGKLNGLFVKEKSSLLEDTKNSLKKLYKIKDIGLKGNSGFSAGSELEDGVENTTPEGTEVGLLDPLVAGIRDAGYDSTKASPMIADALNIIVKQKSLLNAFDKAVPNYKDLHSQKSTAAFLAKSLAAFKTDTPPDYTLESIISGLVNYVKSQAQK